MPVPGTSLDLETSGFVREIAEGVQPCGPVRFFPANGSVGNTARHGVFSVVVANIPMGATGTPRGRDGSPPAIESSAQDEK